MPELEGLRRVALAQLVVHGACLVGLVATAVWAAWPRREGGVALRWRSAGLLVSLLPAALSLLYWLWRIAPTYAAVLEGLGASLTLPTRLSFVASMWIGRLLPLLVLASPVLAVPLLLPFLSRHEGVQRAHLALLLLANAIATVLILAAIGAALQCRALATPA